MTVWGMLRRPRGYDQTEDVGSYTALESLGPERVPGPHLPCWKAMNRRNCCDMSRSRATQDGGAVSFGFCKITCFGSPFWPFVSLLLPWLLERNTVTEGGCNMPQPQEGDLRGERGP